MGRGGTRRRRHPGPAIATTAPWRRASCSAAVSSARCATIWSVASGSEALATTASTSGGASSMPVGWPDARRAFR